MDQGSHLRKIDIRKGVKDRRTKRKTYKSSSIVDVSGPDCDTVLLSLLKSVYTPIAKHHDQPLHDECRDRRSISENGLTAPCKSLTLFPSPPLYILTKLSALVLTHPSRPDSLPAGHALSSAFRWHRSFGTMVSPGVDRVNTTSPQPSAFHMCARVVEAV